jgi:hypothetical protein
MKNKNLQKIKKCENNESSLGFGLLVARLI